MNASEKLIVDAGFHKGEDSGFYLSQGFHVVAIEASSKLVAEGKLNFKKFVDEGQLVILNRAIAEKSGQQVQFHIGEITAWNSLNSNITNRTGQRVETELVETVTLLDVFKQFGVPYYCKIDLEGADETAIASLARDHLPKYISCESECFGWDENTKPEQSLATLEGLRELGYDRFKLINQIGLSEVTEKKLIYRKRNPIINIAKSILKSLKMSPQPKVGTEKLNEKFKYKFPAGASGPGPLDDQFRNIDSWLDYNAIRELILFYRDQRLAVDGKNIWMDIHATHSE